MIEEEQVMHIADLAKLNIDAKDMKKYQQQLSDIMTEIDKITNAMINEDEMMISPTENKNVYFDDNIESHISKKEAFLNAKRVKGDYIIVPKVIE